jgi:uncharacterized surface protein with fasciclin (FAS1) repeats
MEFRMQHRQFLKLMFAATATASIVAALTACGGESNTPAPTPPAPTKNIVELAVATPDLSTLVKAVTAADLAGTLSGPGPFTVFAPTNAAFDKIPTDTLGALLLPSGKADLTKILTYHVVPGKVLKADIPLGTPIATLQGGTITIAVEGGNVVITDAKGGKSMITATDIVATNGVVHVIDTVIMP